MLPLEKFEQFMSEFEQSRYSLNKENNFNLVILILLFTKVLRMLTVTCNLICYLMTQMMSWGEGTASLEFKHKHALKLLLQVSMIAYYSRPKYSRRWFGLVLQQQYYDN